jgi:hypothetical protein
MPPSSTYGTDLLSLTMQEIESEVHEQILYKNAYSALLKEHGKVVEKDGGIKIIIPIEYAENGSYKRYQAAEQLNTSYNDTHSVFEAEWKQIALNVQAHGREIHQNMGRSQIKDLVKSRVRNAKNTFENNFNEDLLSDGTADSSRQISGLQLHIADDPTTGTVQGVSRSTYSFARNQRFRCTTDGGAAVSASNIVGYMDELDLDIAAVKGKTKAILSDETMFKYYEGAVHPLQRITQEKGSLAKLGFRTYQYKDAEVVYEPQLSGMPSATQYWIDPDTCELVVMAGRNLVRLPKRESWNQDASIEYLAWMGNLVFNNYRKNGVLNND